MKASKLTLLALFLALNTILLYLSGTLPFNETLILGACGLITAIAVVETGFSSGVYFYVASCFLGFFFIPNKFLLLGYGFVFGLYPLFKYHIEGLKNLKKEVPLKGLLFLMLCGIYYVGGQLFFPNKMLLTALPLLLFILMVNDAALSIFLGYYAKIIRPKIKKF